MPKSGLEAADRILGYLEDHEINVDYFDRAELVRSNIAVTLPELKTMSKRKSLVHRSHLFIAGVFASTRAKDKNSELSDLDILFLNSPEGTTPHET